MDPRVLKGPPGAEVLPEDCPGTGVPGPQLAVPPGVRGVLSQTQDGYERIVAYLSQGLSQPERNYCVTGRELLAILKSLELADGVTKFWQTVVAMMRSAILNDMHNSSSSGHPGVKTPSRLRQHFLSLDRHTSRRQGVVPVM